jgi:DNA-binding CsgD family transcriptional regulator
MPAAGEGTVAVIVEQATAAKVAPTVMLAYGLTEQERTVTGLSCRGLSTREIAEQLYLSQHTVRDHLKSVFEKVGVSTGRGLTATILQQQYLPRAKAGQPLGPSGFYVNRGAPHARPRQDRPRRAAASVPVRTRSACHADPARATVGLKDEAACGRSCRISSAIAQRACHDAADQSSSATTPAVTTTPRSRATSSTQSA